MTEARATAPVVFVSYAHDNDDHVRVVLRLATLLRNSGIDVRLDQWADGERIDWALWVDRTMPAADYVLAIASPEFLRRSMEQASADETWGLQYEAAMLRELLTADRSRWRARILPVLLPGHDVGELPPFLQGHTTTHYRVSFGPGGTDALLRVLTGHAAHPEPPLGPRWTPPADEAGDGIPQRDRVVSPSRAALTDPARLILPLLRRDSLESVFLPAVEQALAVPAVVAIHAEAGMGKSVLLAQLHDELANRPDVGVVLVSLSEKVTDRPRTLAELDAQLGAAVGRPGTLSDVVGLQQAWGLRPVVLLDTLDLVLDRELRPVLTQWLHQLVENGVPVVFTCRSFEFRTQLEPISERMPLLAARLDRREIYRLSEAETRHFARSYVETLAEVTPDRRDAFLERLLHLRGRRRAVVEVCGNPLLLALACSLYAPTGEIPEDLTVARLFRAHWNRQVIGSPRRSLTYTEAEERGRVCLSGGRAILDRSTTAFAENFRAAQLEPPPDPGALADLCSAGILVPAAEPTRFRFFHQSFAEWVIARYLAEAGTDRTAFLLRLADPGQRGHLGPILVQLLYTLEDPAEYQRTVARLDLDDLLSLRAVALSAVTRGDLGLVAELFGRRTSPEHEWHVVEALGAAAENDASAVADLLLAGFARISVSVLLLAARVLGDLVARSAERERLLPPALEAIAGRRPDMADADQRGQLPERLLEALAETTDTGADRAVLRQYYGRLGPLARTVILRLHTGVPASEAASLLEVALQLRMPAASTAEAVALARTVFADAAARQTLQWDSWQAMLAKDYAAGWDDVQCQLVADLISDVHSVPLHDLFDAAMSADRAVAQRAVYVLEKVAAREPSATFGLLLAEPAPADRRALALVRTMLIKAPPIERALAARLIAWLEPALAVDPRLIGQAMIHAASTHADLLADVIARTNHLPGRDFFRIVSAVLDVCPVPELAALLPGLRPVAEGTDGLAARVAGAFAPIDARARERCAALALGAAATPAKAAVHRLVITAIELGWFDAALAGQLLTARHPGAVQNIGRWITEAVREPLPEDLAARLTEALDRATASPVVAALTAALADDIRRNGPLAARAATLTEGLIARSEDPACPADLARELIRSAHSLLLLQLTAGCAEAVLRPLVRRAVHAPALTHLDEAAELVERVVRRAGSFLRGGSPAVLDELLEELPGLPGRAQEGVARATRLDRGEQSPEFRRIAERTTDAGTRTYVLGRLG
ncbi:SEFIR domain-containing protein [Amycolatopsis sp. lyj-23]|uniref:SEFIR domain-containing protein n=1 Tax=Amycolatopsis sp. lyj-23 TaxID=2789283 RepID=UPI00397A17DC